MPVDDYIQIMIESLTKKRRYWTTSLRRMRNSTTAWTVRNTMISTGIRSI